MMVFFGMIFALFAAGYVLLAAAVFYHLFHYTLPGWTAARVAAPVFIFISAALFILAAYFFFSVQWTYFEVT